MSARAGSLLVCAVLVTGLVAGCGVPIDDEPRALLPAEAPFQVLQSRQPAAPTGENRAVLYFVQDDRVVRQTRRVEVPADAADVLELLLAGPTPEQVEEGISSALPSTFTVEGVELEGDGVAVVTLGGSSTQLSASPLAFAQVVATLTAPGLADAVRFRLDDEDLPVPRGDASVTEAPVDRRDYADLLGPSPDGDPTAQPDPVQPAASGSPAPG